MKAKGIRTELVSLDEQIAKTVSWTGNACDVSAYEYAIILANITAFDTASGDERLILEIEGSYDGSLWEHFYTFVDEANAGDNTSTSGDPDRGKIKTTGVYVIHLTEIPLAIRVKGTLSGTTPSVSLTVKGNFR